MNIPGKRKREMETKRLVRKDILSNETIDRILLGTNEVKCRISERLELKHGRFNY